MPPGMPDGFLTGTTTAIPFRSCATVDQMARRHPPPPQSIRFCRSTDDVRIAYARYGQGPPLIIATCWLSHLEYDLESPVWRHWVEGMGSIATTVRYDERGFGLSDWQVPDFSFESRISDLEAVIEASGFDEFALLGMSQGGPVAMAYAHRHPERVTRLILHGSYVATLGPSMDSAEMEDAFIRMVEVGWARPEGRFRRVFTDMLMPGATPEQMTWVDELMKMSTSTDERRRIPAPATRRRRLGSVAAVGLSHSGAACQGRPDERIHRGSATGRGDPGCPSGDARVRQPRPAGGRTGLAGVPARDRRVPGARPGIGPTGVRSRTSSPRRRPGAPDRAGSGRCSTLVAAGLDNTGHRGQAHA